MSKWISVLHKLPPACQDVIAYGKPGRSWIVFWTYISTHPREVVDDENITHWMLLPEPPK